jgi:hypothetical protein
MSQIESTIMCGRKSSISTKTKTKATLLTTLQKCSFNHHPPPPHKERLVQRVAGPSLPLPPSLITRHPAKQRRRPNSSLNSSALLPLFLGTSTGNPTPSPLRVTWGDVLRIEAAQRRRTRRARAGTATTPSPAAGAAARSARRAEIVFSFSEIFFIACWWLCVNSSMRRRCCSIVLRRTSSRLAASSFAVAVCWVFADVETATPMSEMKGRQALMVR